MENLPIAAAKMIASLFFAKLWCMPTFSSGQAVARVELQCRLPTGPPLFTFLIELRQQHAWLHCRGHRGQFVIESLVPLPALNCLGSTLNLVV